MAVGRRADGVLVAEIERDPAPLGLVRARLAELDDDRDIPSLAPRRPPRRAWRTSARRRSGCRRRSAARRVSSGVEPAPRPRAERAGDDRRCRGRRRCRRAPGRCPPARRSQAPRSTARPSALRGGLGIRKRRHLGLAPNVGGRPPRRGSQPAPACRLARPRPRLARSPLRPAAASTATGGTNSAMTASTAGSARTSGSTSAYACSVAEPSMSTGFAVLASAGGRRRASRVSSESGRQLEPGCLAGVRAENPEPARVRDHGDAVAARRAVASRAARRRREAPPSVSARSTPAWRKSASTAASEPASAAVWDPAARRPEHERPLFIARIGFCAGEPPREPGELPRVPERLEVHQDEVGALVVLPPLEQVVRGDVGLVPDRDEGTRRRARGPRRARAAPARARRSARRTRSGPAGTRAARRSR